VNGEAIYGTRPWKTFGEGPTKVVEGPMHEKDAETYTSEDFRFTAKGNAIYAIEMAWPTNGEALIRSLNDGSLSSNQKIESVVLLGSDAKLEFDQKPDGLHIHLTGHPPHKYAYAYRILLHE
jgi:alpha-L-fucosidase